MSDNLRKCPCVADIDWVSVQRVAPVDKWERYQVQCCACGSRGPITETAEEACDGWNFHASDNTVAEIRLAVKELTIWGGDESNGKKLDAILDLAEKGELPRIQED